VTIKKTLLDYEHLVFSISGMSCSSCASKIEKKVTCLDGVKRITVNFGAEQGAIDYDPNKVSFAEVREVIKNIGFEVLAKVESFFIEGMTCASCVSKVENKLREFHEVLNVEVNLARGRAWVNHISSISKLRDFQIALNNLGYVLIPDERSSVGAKDVENERYTLEMTVLLRKFLFSIFSATLIMISGMESLQDFLPRVDSTEFNLLMLVIATPVQFWAGWGFYRATWIGLKHGYSDMNTLIVMGTSAAYFYSALVILFPQLFLITGQKVSIYFDSSVMIIALVLMGRLLEARAKAKASEAIRKLIGLQPKIAKVERDSKEEDVPIDKVVDGEL